MPQCLYPAPRTSAKSRTDAAEPQRYQSHKKGVAGRPRPREKPLNQARNPSVLVWSKNSCGVPVVIFQQPAEPFAAANRCISLIRLLERARYEARSSSSSTDPVMYTSSFFHSIVPPSPDRVHFPENGNEYLLRPSNSNYLGSRKRGPKLVCGPTFQFLDHAGIGAGIIDIYSRRPPTSRPTSSPKSSNDILTAALEKHRGNISKAARALGLHGQNLQQKLRQLEISAETFRT